MQAGFRLGVDVTPAGWQAVRRSARSRSQVPAGTHPAILRSADQQGAPRFRYELNQPHHDTGRWNVAVGQYSFGGTAPYTSKVIRAARLHSWSGPTPGAVASQPLVRRRGLRMTGPAGACHKQFALDARQESLA